MGNTTKKLADLTIRDNFMFANVMTDEENCRTFLEMVLGVPIRTIDASYEKSIAYHPDYKGVRLDVMATGEDNTRYNIEVQVQNRHIEKRSRYYHSQMDMEMLARGKPYDVLPDSYVIFVCDYDPVGEKKYRYTFEHTCREVQDYILKDGSHTVFLSTEGTNGAEEPKELVKFLEFVGADLKDSTGDFGDEYVSRLQRSIREIKNSREKEAQFMLLEEMLKDRYTEGISVGRSQGIDIGYSQGVLRQQCDDILVILSELGTVPEVIKNRLEAESDADRLSRMLRLAAKAKTIDDFEKGLED